MKLTVSHNYKSSTRDIYGKVRMEVEKQLKMHKVFQCNAICMVHNSVTTLHCMHKAKFLMKTCLLRLHNKILETDENEWLNLAIISVHRVMYNLMFYVLIHVCSVKFSITLLLILPTKIFPLIPTLISHHLLMESEVFFCVSPPTFLGS